MREIMIAGNWKMNTTVEEGSNLIDGIKAKVAGLNKADVQVVVCPPFPHLLMAQKQLAGSSLRLGAQNMHFEDKGAYTGEVSPLMIKDICEYVIIGHSERREYFAETDESVNKKVKAALAHELKPIVCVGETLEIRERGDYLSFLASQVKAAFDHVELASADLLVIAYEPIWAIGTGKAASAEQGQEVIKMIRATLSKLYPSFAEDMLILYGGSSNDENIVSFLQEEDIDGVLVGGASLKADVFGRMVERASKL